MLECLSKEQTLPVRFPFFAPKPKSLEIKKFSRLFEKVTEDLKE